MPKSTKLTNEKAIEKQCIELLRIRGIWCQKVHSGALMVAAGPARYRVNLADQGTPDIIACVKGRMLGIEVKDSPEECARWRRVIQSYLATGDDDHTRTIKPSWEREVCQYLQHELIRKAGGEVILCCSVDELIQDMNMLLSEYEAEDIAKHEHLSRAGAGSGTVRQGHKVTFDLSSLRGGQGTSPAFLGTGQA